MLISLYRNIMSLLVALCSLVLMYAIYTSFYPVLLGALLAWFFYTIKVPPIIRVIGIWSSLIVTVITIVTRLISSFII